MLNNMNANTNVVANVVNTNANEEVVMNANTNANVVAMRNALNAMSLNYMWSIVDEEAYIDSYGNYDPQHYTAIINIISDYTDYINEQYYIEQAEDFHCGGLFWEQKHLPNMTDEEKARLEDDIKEFEVDFMREAYSKDYSHIIFQRGEVVPF